MARKTKYRGVREKRAWVVGKKRYWSEAAAKHAAQAAGVPTPRPEILGYEASVRIRGFPDEYQLFGSAKDASDWRERRRRELKSDPDSVDRRKMQKVLIDEMISSYEEDVAKRQRDYDDSTSGRLKRLREFFRGYSIIAFKPAAVAQYIRERRAAGCKDDTVIRELTILRAAIDHAATMYEIPMPWSSSAQHPVYVAKKQLRLRTAPGRMRRLSEDEWQRALRVAVNYNPRKPGRAFHLLVFLAETPLRRGEAVNLRWRDVDLERGSIYVRDTKNDESRLVWLTAMAQEALRAVREIPPRPPGENERVWDMQPRSMSQIIENIGDAAGIEDWRLHDLRHESATRMLELGLSEYETRMQTGHKTASMLSRYAHMCPERLGRRLRELESSVQREASDNVVSLQRRRAEAK